jgi:hypothetical protein
MMRLIDMKRKERGLDPHLPPRFSKSSTALRPIP